MRLVGWAFRYSHRREAYVLRGVGRRYGPVLKPEGSAGVARVAQRAQVGRVVGPAVDDPLDVVDLRGGAAAYPAAEAVKGEDLRSDAPPVAR